MKAIFFDANHTIIGLRNELETQSAGVDVLYGEVCQLRDEVLDRGEFRRVFNEGWDHGKRKSFEKYEETTYESIVEWVLLQYSISLRPEHLERVLQVYMAPLYDNAYVIEGMFELLSELRQSVKLGVITNYKYGAGMRGLLERVGIMSWFDVVCISSEVGWKKPDERIYRTALTQAEVDAEDVVLVGNELEKDLWQAYQLGMKVILFHPKEHESHDAEFAQLLHSRLDTSGMRIDGIAYSAEDLRREIGLLKG